MLLKHWDTIRFIYPVGFFSLFLLFGRRQLLAFIDFTPSRQNHDVTPLGDPNPTVTNVLSVFDSLLVFVWVGSLLNPPDIKATALTSKKSSDFFSSFSIPEPRPFQPLTARCSHARASRCPGSPALQITPGLLIKKAARSITGLASRISRSRSLRLAQCCLSVCSVFSRDIFAGAELLDSK